MRKSTWIPLTALIIVVTALVSCQYMNAVLTNSYEAKLAKQAKAYDEKIANLEAQTEKYGTLSEIEELAEAYYMGELDDKKVEEGLISGYIYGMGDRYAYYYSPDDFTTYNEENNGKMVGIGVRVIYDNTLGGIYVTAVMPGSPALESGLSHGDLIVGVEDKYVADIGYYEAVNMIKNGDENTFVKLYVARKSDDYKTAEEITVERRTIDNKTVYSEMIYGNIGYVEITEFNKTTSDELKNAVLDLMANGAEKLVFDVRNNPGGDLDGVAGALDFLLPEGPIIHIVSKKGVEKVINSDENCIDLPMSVLVNGSTASAGELFCCSLKDYGKAVLVGTQTYGKGSMQSVIRLSNGGGFSFTTNRYDPPYSENYDGVGVTPDIEIELTEELAAHYYDMTHDEDIQLQAALKALENN